MANLHLVTGHAGEPHVKSTDDASLMQAIYGCDSVVLDRNNAFSCDVISNNLIRVNDGEALMQGRYIKLDKGNYVDLNIDNGHTGYKRIDVIAIEYSKDDETNIEETNLVVVKGSETQQEEATVPELIEGDTVDGSASTNQMALYHVKIDGLSITDVTQAFTLGQDFQTTISEKIGAISGKIDTIEAVIPEIENDVETLDTLTESIKGTGAGFHSSIYRGKYLGDTYTNAQKEAIASGTFDDLFIGDYWTINGVNWRIADFDYYYNVLSFNKHHVVIVPDSVLYNARMNSSNTTSGCYTRSEMYTSGLNNARTAFYNAFGSSFIPTHTGLYSNATTTNAGIPSGHAFRDMRVELMNEEQVYGHAAWGTTGQNGFDVGTQKVQFRLFALDNTKINIGQIYWLTNVKSSTNFCVVSGGEANNVSASSSYGVRPFACLVGDSE